MFLNQRRKYLPMLLETFLEKGRLNQMMFLLRFLGDLLLFHCHYLVVCIVVCSHTQIDLRYFDNVYMLHGKFQNCWKG